MATLAVEDLSEAADAAHSLSAAASKFGDWAAKSGYADQLAAAGRNYETVLSLVGEREALRRFRKMTPRAAIAILSKERPADFQMPTTSSSQIRTRARERRPSRRTGSSSGSATRSATRGDPDREPPLERPCGCGCGLFTPKRSDQLYREPGCRVRAHRARAQAQPRPGLAELLERARLARQAVRAGADPLDALTLVVCPKTAAEARQLLGAAA